MSLPIPTNPQQLQQRSLADLQRHLPTTANPFLPESWMGAQGIANANRVFEVYKMLSILEREAIPYYAVDLLEQWASYWGITRNPATGSTGTIVFTGTATTIVPALTEVTVGGAIYNTTSPCTISANSVVPASITRVGTTATLTLSSAASDIFDGLEVTISGASPSQYNGTYNITLISSTQFSYTMASDPGASASPVGTVAYTSGFAAAESQSFGEDTNLDASERLTLSTPIAGVDNSVYVNPEGFSGGTDEEDNDSLRSRLLYRVQNPVAMFNVAQITTTAKTVSGVTDVFVEENTPDVGKVLIYFVRTNDANPIPNAAQVLDVNAVIQAIRPATTAVANCVVSAPTPVSCSWTFTTISPDTTTMRSAITASLQALCLDYGVVGSPLTEDQYRSAIVNTIDTTTGEQLASFTLTTTGDFGGASGEYPVFSSVTFP